MRFEEAYQGWTARRLTQEEAAAQRSAGMGSSASLVMAPFLQLRIFFKCIPHCLEELLLCIAMHSNDFIAPPIYHFYRSSPSNISYLQPPLLLSLGLHVYNPALSGR